MEREVHKALESSSIDSSAEFFVELLVSDRVSLVGGGVAVVMTDGLNAYLWVVVVKSLDTDR